MTKQVSVNSLRLVAVMFILIRHPRAGHQGRLLLDSSHQLSGPMDSGQVDPPHIALPGNEASIWVNVSVEKCRRGSLCSRETQPPTHSVAHGHF